MRRKTLLSWSSGKDSAWALHVLGQRSDLEIAGLVTTVNQLYQRIAIHAVRLELLQRQAQADGFAFLSLQLPLTCRHFPEEAYFENIFEQAAIKGIQVSGFSLSDFTGD